MREIFTYGSVGGAPGNRCFYPEPDGLQPPVMPDEKKMKKLTGSQLVSEFIRRLRDLPYYSVTTSSISRNVFRLSGNFESFIYVKGRAEEPHRWGVTKNVVKRLENQNISWFVILLFNTPETGYLLSQSDVRSYISSVWPLGADGDYKTATGSYLSNNVPFHSISIFADQIEGLMTS